MKCVHTLLAASLLAVSFGASAATNLSVTGTIKPVSCTLDIAGGGTYDVGDIAKGSLNASTFTTLARQDKDVTLACGEAGAAVSLTLADNDHASSAWSSTYEYGLGRASDGVTQLGSYEMYVQGAKMDGVAVKTGNALLGANPTTWTAVDYLTSDKQLAPIDDSNQLMRTTNLTFKLNLKPFIQKTSGFPAGVLNQEQTIAGNSTLTVNYL